MARPRVVCSLRRDLADGRHSATPSRKKPLIAVGIFVVAVLVAVGVFSLSGGEAGPLGGIVGSDTPDAPEFAFDPTKPKAVETSANPNHKAATAAAEPAAETVTQQLDELYTAAFLEPGNWMEGDYEQVLEFFAGGARDEAETKLDVLTAGPEAGSAFDTIDPLPSTLKVRVLLTADRTPHAVEGSVRFSASGEGTGASVLLVSKGQFIFEKSDGEWLVTAFSVQRNDKQDEPRASSTPGATEGSVTPSAADAS